MRFRQVVLWLATAMAGATAARGKGPPAQPNSVAPTPLYLVTAGCGSLAELNDQVARRSRQIVLTASSGPSPPLEADINRLGADRIEVVLTAVQTSGERFSRRLQAETCDEAVAALALLIVLALDPAAVTTIEPAPRTAPRASPRRAARDAGTPAEATTPEPADPVPPDGAIPKADETVSKIEASPIAPQKTAPDGRRLRRSVLSVGAGGIMVGGPAPRPLAGASLYAVWGWDRESPWSPAVTLAVGHSESNGLAFTGGTADFALDALQLEVCPVWVGMRRRWGGRVCGLGIAGALAARGVQTLAPEAHRRVFVLFGGSVAVIYQPGWRIELVASGGIGFPLQRYAFQFEPTVVHRVEAVSLMGGLSVGIRFH